MLKDVFQILYATIFRQFRPKFQYLLNLFPMLESLSFDDLAKNNCSLEASNEDSCNTSNQPIIALTEVLDEGIEKDYEGFFDLAAKSSKNSPSTVDDAKVKKCYGQSDGSSSQNKNCLSVLIANKIFGTLVHPKLQPIFQRSAVHESSKESNAPNQKNFDTLLSERLNLASLLSERRPKEKKQCPMVSKSSPNLLCRKNEEVELVEEEKPCITNRSVPQANSCETKVIEAECVCHVPKVFKSKIPVHVARFKIIRKTRC